MIDNLTFNKYDYVINTTKPLKKKKNQEIYWQHSIEYRVRFKFIIDVNINIYVILFLL